MFERKTEKTFFFALKLFVREMTNNNITYTHFHTSHENKQTRRQNCTIIIYTPYMCILTGRKNLDHKEVVECTISCII